MDTEKINPEIEEEEDDALDTGTTEVEDEDIDDSDSDDSGEEEEGFDSEDDEKVPLKTYLDLKNKYKKIKKDHLSLKEKSFDSDLKAFKSKKMQEYVELGYDEELAEKLVSDLVELRQELKTSKRSDFEDMIYEEIDELKDDNLFDDIHEYKEEIVEKIKETKKKGYDLNVEDAYILVTRQNKRAKLKDQKTKNTQREVLKRKSGSTKTNVATSNSTPTKTKFNLDSNDKIALKRLQEMQPDAGWTPKKYYDTLKT